jgi:hypothetical protein
MFPQFPEFKPIGAEDRDLIEDRLREYRPETSELNFSNMFIWRLHYGFEWSLWRDWLLVIGANSGNGVQALPPVGPPSRLQATRMLLEWLREERKTPDPGIDRADARLVSELEEAGGFLVEPVRDHFDYVYRTADLIALAGKDYRAKRNHLNYFLRSYAGRMAYEPLDTAHVDACLAVAENWCALKRCEDDLSLIGEWDAVREALKHLTSLRARGGVMLIDGKVEAFTLGERLNDETVVVHVEKANTTIRGLYAAINQQFCEKEWSDAPFVNREQDLGDPGLREAKLSYNPDRMIEKYRIRLAR